MVGGRARESPPVFVEHLTTQCAVAAGRLPASGSSLLEGRSPAANAVVCDSRATAAEEEGATPFAFGSGVNLKESRMTFWERPSHCCLASAVGVISS